MILAFSVTVSTFIRQNGKVEECVWRDATRNEARYGLNTLLTRYNNYFLATTVSWLSLRVSPLMTNAGLSRI